jgi:hypothetical protein
MDYKFFARYFTVLITWFCIFFFTGCSGKENSNIDNTFYIELDKFTHDSLRQTVSENIFGKVSYYKNKELQILSLNYVTEEYPGMHYFQNAAALTKEIKPGTKKVKITFGGDFSVDSISYSLQKFIYRNNAWNKVSDMGMIKERNSYKKSSRFAILDFGMQIVNNTVVYTYN